jgi:hypothetical protein
LPAARNLEDGVGGGYGQIAIMDKRANIGGDNSKSCAPVRSDVSIMAAASLSESAPDTSSVGDLAALAGRSAMAIRVDGDWGRDFRFRARRTSANRHIVCQGSFADSAAKNISPSAMRRPARPSCCSKDAIAPLAQGRRDWRR